MVDFKWLENVCIYQGVGLEFAIVYAMGIFELMFG